MDTQSKLTDNEIEMLIDWGKENPDNARNAFMGVTVGKYIQHQIDASRTCAVEFGFRCAEKGMNLQAAIRASKDGG